MRHTRILTKNPQVKLSLLHESPQTVRIQGGAQHIPDPSIAMSLLRFAVPLCFFLPNGAANTSL